MPTPPPRLGATCVLVCVVWCQLALVQLAWPGCIGVALSFAIALGWIAHRCPRVEPSHRCPTRLIGQALAFMWVGVAIQPALGAATWYAFVAATGATPRLDAAAAPCAFELVSCLALAPAFEEWLYRGRLLAALEPRVGRWAAVVVSAACFALPHATPVRMLGTFLAGLALGLVWLATRRVSPCTALHVGLNVAVVAPRFDAAAL